MYIYKLVQGCRHTDKTRPLEGSPSFHSPLRPLTLLLQLPVAPLRRPTGPPPIAVPRARSTAVAAPRPTRLPGTPHRGARPQAANAYIAGRSARNPAAGI